MSKPELEVQKFLRAVGGPIAPLDLLQSRYAIKHTRHTKYPNLVLLKYHQIDSPFEERLVCECRGLILDEANNWEVVAYPYDKFFNAGESLAAKIDWSTARAYDKLDGSIVCSYFYNGRWEVSTSGVPDGTNSVGDFGTTFGELFRETLAYSYEDLDPKYNYMFELCGPKNRVVVPYVESTVVLHGIRNMDTLLEEDPFDEGERIDVDSPRWSRPLDLVQVQTWALHCNPLELEGFVVRDAQFNRIKVKCPAYVTLHHAKDGLMSRRGMAEIVRKGELAEALSYFPELRATFDDIKRQHASLIHDVELVWKTIRDIEDRKTFAGLATKHSFSGVLFAMKDGKAESVAAAIQKMPESAYQRLLGL